MTPEDILLHWHRLFGIILTDLFSGTPWRVELEMELARRRQILDVVIIARAQGAEGTIPSAAGLDLPDGLEDLRSHNLLTYKSQHEPLSVWSLEELVGHYVNYRKQQTGPDDRLLPEADFGLYAVAVRFPRNLAREVPLRPTAMPGVFDIHCLARQIRLVVLGDIEPHPRNAAWELFSVSAQAIRHGAEHYRFRSPGAGELLNTLYLAYKLERPDMAYTMEQFIVEARQEILQHMTPEERLRGLDPEERLRGLDPEERLRGLAPEERLRGLAPEERLRGLAPEERLRGLAPEERLRGLAPEARLCGLAPEDVLKRYDPEARLRGLGLEERLRGLSAEEVRELRERLSKLN